MSMLVSLQKNNEFNDMYFVTPGIRGASQSEFDNLTKNKLQDQKRTMSAKEAIEYGASAIVVGRPILEASKPKNEALKYSMSIFE